MASARALDETDVGPWIVAGNNANAVRLATGETTMTDIALGGQRLQFVYSYAGDQAEHGIWSSILLSSE